MMKILLAADGSRFTKKALAYIVVNDLLREEGSTLYVINVQSPMPPEVSHHLGREVVKEYQSDQAEKVLRPIQRFLARHGIEPVATWREGYASDVIINEARKNKVQMIVMGTHGHGLLGRIVMGSVAQRVVADSPVPVLLVK